MVRATRQALRDTLADVLKAIDQSEQYESCAIRIRQALGLCVTTGCDQLAVTRGPWAHEYCRECLSDA